MYVFYAKLPSTSLTTDGLLIRLMSVHNVGDHMYTIRILKNRQVSIARSVRSDDGSENDNIQTMVSSTSTRWLSSERYTGFWVLFNNG